jgi:predicted alpha/beta hydrolase family esterase
MQTIFLHGAGVVPDRDQPQAYPLLATLLDLCPDLIVPVMPTAMEPTPDGWLQGMEAALRPLDPDAVIIGHSLGGSMALKWIAERAPGFEAQTFLGLAIPHWGPKGWNYPGFAQPAGYAAATAGLDRIILAAAQDDDVVESHHLDLYAADLPRARLLRLTGGGHGLDHPDVLPLLDAVVRRAALPKDD